MKARQSFWIVVEISAQAVLDVFRRFVDAGHTLEMLRMRPQNDTLVITAMFGAVEEAAARQLVREIRQLRRVRSASVEAILVSTD